MPNKCNMRALIDLAGKTFGDWSVVGSEHIRGKYDTHWLCRCSCGVEREVRSAALRLGESTHCGHRSKLGGMSKTHARERNVWYGLFIRCGKQRGYESIAVCDRWTGENGFINFIADMGRRPENTTLDRIDPLKGYDKSNCRWAVWQMQKRNKRNVRAAVVDGVPVPMSAAMVLMSKKATEGWIPVVTFSRPSAIREQIAAFLGAPPSSSARPCSYGPDELHE